RTPRLRELLPFQRSTSRFVDPGFVASSSRGSAPLGGAPARERGGAAGEVLSLVASTRGVGAPRGDAASDASIKPERPRATRSLRSGQAAPPGGTGLRERRRKTARRFSRIEQHLEQGPLGFRP